MDNNVRIGSQFSKPTSINTSSLTATQVASTIKSGQTALPNQSAQVMGINNQSAISVFLSTLKSIPFCSQILRDLLDCIDGQSDEDGYQKILEQLENSFSSKSKGLSENIKNSFVNSSKYNSQVFEPIKKFYSSLSSSKDKKVIIEFAKAYDCFVSSKSINQTIINNLKNILSLLMQNEKQEFNNIISTYYCGDDFKKTASNIKLLEDKIFPFLNKYILITRDFGEVRNEISSLIHNVMRLQIGCYENLKMWAKKLFTLQGFKQTTLISSDKELLNLVLLEIKSQNAPNIQETIRDLIETGLNEKNLLNLNDISTTTLKALLLSQSCYIPIANILLMLSQAEDKSYEIFQIYFDQEYSNTFKIIIVANIKTLGDVECILYFNKSDISVEIYGPMFFVDNSKLILQKIDQIIKNNGLKKNRVNIGLFNKNENIAMLFNKIGKRKKGINGEI